MRIAFEKVAILERTRLALIDIYRHQTRCRCRFHDAPFATGRKSCAAQATQAGVFHFGEHTFCFAFAIDDVKVSLVAAVGLVGGQICDASPLSLDPSATRGEGRNAHRISHVLGRRMTKRILPHANRRRFRTAPDAGHRNYPHILAQNARQFFQQIIRTGHLARQRFANAHGQRRRRCLAFLHHIKVMIKSGDFIDFRLGDFHLLR